jgi:hypothetical protein
VYPSFYGAYPAKIKLILLEIIEAPLRTIETIELVGMERYISFSGHSIQREMEKWRHLEGILQDTAFSRLKEIRLLFNCGSTRALDHPANSCEHLSCRSCEQTALELGLILQQTYGRSVQLTYGSTYGRDGLLSIQ